ncbi:MAG: hypothetical protein NTV52_05680 [Acidobacteria bacterium]|nr:hypothetical protein [Acidobacteriota bacterium]
MNFAASVLRSGAVIAQAGHVLALVAGFGWFSTGRWALTVSLLAWFFHCYIALRVVIDAALFADLAGREDALDEWLVHFRLRRSTTPRSLDDRTRAALRLWKLQLAAFALQAILLALGWIG